MIVRDFHCWFCCYSQSGSCRAWFKGQMVFTIQLKPQRVAQEGQEQMNYLRDMMEELYMEQLNNINQVARLPDPDHPLSSSEWNKSFDLMIMNAARGDHGNQAVYQLKMKMFGP